MNALDKWLSRFEVGDNVQIIPLSLAGNRIKNVKSSDITSYKVGTVVAIYNYYIRVQFTNFSECFKFCDKQEVIIV